MQHAIFLFLCFFSMPLNPPPLQTNDAVLGRWMSEENNLEVEVFRSGNEYRARVVWFDDSDDKTAPMDSRCDTHNPDKKLRSRKIIGLEVLHGLFYNSDDAEWQGGKIYDSSSGKTYDAKAWIPEKGILKVRGYWHFQFLGQTMAFRKINF